MFDVFGEFNSADEINEVAIQLRKQKDKESLFKLAKENGIDTDIVDAFLDGDIFYITDTLSAAFGKLDVELQEMKNDALGSEIVEIIKSKIIDDTEMQMAIRKKGKKLEIFIKSLWAEAKKRAKKCSGGSGQGCSIMPSEEYRLVKKYYLEDIVSKVEKSDVAADEEDEDEEE